DDELSNEGSRSSSCWPGIDSEGGTSSQLMVKHSSLPSRRLSAASACSRSSHCARFSSLAIPALASSFQAARIRDLVCSCWSLGYRSMTFRSLCWRHLALAGTCKHHVDGGAQSLRAIDDEQASPLGLTPRSTKLWSRSLAAAAFLVAPSWIPST